MTNDEFTAWSASPQDLYVDFKEMDPDTYPDGDDDEPVYGFNRFWCYSAGGDCGQDQCDGGGYELHCFKFQPLPDVDVANDARYDSTSSGTA